MLDKLQGEQSVVDILKIGTIHLDHVDLKLVPFKVVIEALKKFFGAFVKEKRSVNQIHAEQASRLLMQQSVLLVEPCVEHNLIGLLVCSRLKFDAKPPMTLACLVVVDGGHRIGKGEVLFGGMVVTCDPLLNEVVLVFEHFVNARFTYIASLGFLAVDRIAEVLVVCGNGLGNGARRSACTKKMANHFLARADFGKGAVQIGIEIDPEGLLFGRENDAFQVHSSSIEVCIKGKDTFVA